MIYFTMLSISHGIIFDKKKQRKIYEMLNHKKMDITTKQKCTRIYLLKHKVIKLKFG